jgi:adenosylhomocysteine nucleosidase
MNQGLLLSHLRSPADEHLVVCALPSELPEMLPERVLFTGVGKINATHVLTRYLVNHPEIKTVINYGTAGGAHNVKKGALIKCTTFLQGDMDCGGLAEPGITFGDDPIVSAVIQFGTEGSICRTQDQFIESLDGLDLFQHLVNNNKFNVVDMEAYALAKVCTHLHVDFHCYKYVSDDANENANTDWQENISKGEPLFYDVLREYFNFVHIQ